MPKQPSRSKIVINHFDEAAWRFMKLLDSWRRSDLPEMSRQLWHLRRLGLTIQISGEKMQSLAVRAASEGRPLVSKPPPGVVSPWEIDRSLAELYPPLAGYQASRLGETP